MSNTATTTTTTRRKRAKIDFSPVYTTHGEFVCYRGHLCGAETDQKYVDSQDEWNIRLNYRVTITPDRDDPRDWYILTTKGRLNGGVRHRWGTLADMIAAAEKWAARRFYIEQKDTAHNG